MNQSNNTFDFDKYNEYSLILIVVQLLFSSGLDYCVVALFFVHIRIKNDYRPIKLRIRWGNFSNNQETLCKSSNTSD